MVILDMDQDGTIFIHDQVHAHIQPFEGANLEPAALEFTGIDPYHPLRMARLKKRRSVVCLNQFAMLLSITGVIAPY